MSADPAFFVNFVVHLGMVIIAALLWPQAPDNIQRALLAVIITSFALFALASFLQFLGIRNWAQPVLGFERTWEIKIWAGEAAKLALMMYLVRQTWVKTGLCALIHQRPTPPSAISEGR